MLASVPLGVNAFVWRLGFDFDADTVASGTVQVTA
jgi:hypothetical protein